jgi:hypothetical protein
LSIVCVDLEVRAELSALDAYYIFFRSSGILLRLPLEEGVGSRGSTVCKKALQCLQTRHAQLDRASQVRVAKVFASRHRHVEPLTLLLCGKSWGLTPECF